MVQIIACNFFSIQDFQILKNTKDQSTHKKNLVLRFSKIQGPRLSSVKFLDRSRVWPYYFVGLWGLVAST